MQKHMHCGPIHRLPEDLWVEGVIAFNPETGFFTFYRATTDTVQSIKERLEKSNAEGIRVFEGYKQQLISVVKPLNDKIRAKQVPVEDQKTLPGEGLLCPTAA